MATLQQRLVLALEAVKLGQWDQAERLMAPAMATPLAQPAIWTIFAAVAARRGEPIAAIRRLRAALILDPAMVRVIDDLVNAVQDLGDRSTTHRWLDHRRALDPGHAETHSRIARLTGLGDRRSFSARPAALRSLLLAPDSSGSVMTFVTVELTLNPNVKGNPFAHMLRICCPDSPRALDMLLSDRMRAGDGDQVRALFARTPPGLEERLAALLLEPGGSVLDIGANKGFTALGFLRGGASRVHCIEPNPDMVALIRANVTGPVTVHQVALGDREGMIDLVIPTGHPGAASIDPSFNAAKVTASGGSKRIPVTLIRLDDLEIERCDFWKVDVEGVEIEAMKGAKKTRAAKPPRWILAEIAGEPFRPPGHLDAFTRAVADTHPLRYEVLSDSLGVTRLVALPLGNAPTTIMERGTGTPLFLFASEPPPEIVP